MKLIVQYRCSSPDNEEERVAWMEPGIHNLPDDTESFLRRVAPLGRFSIDQTTIPPTLYFQNDYD